MSKTLYLIDGHAQIYRAYYAPFGNLSAPSGEPTRATHVFLQMVLNLIRDKQPDYLATVLDVSDETVFRTEIYPEYKAHRDPPPEDLPLQIDRIRGILEQAQVPIVRVHGFEADDILATLARRYASEDLHVYFVSRDKDLEQLLSEHVSLFDPMKDTVITADGLVELRGWTPTQAVDAQTLIGDSVDNIPGVPGIGPKTAAKLIEKYGSAKGVIEHADELTPKQRENVRAFAPQLEITRQLVTLRDDVPVDFDLERADPQCFTWNAVRNLFHELGFRRLIEQLPDADPETSPSSSTTPTGPDDELPTSNNVSRETSLSTPTAEMPTPPESDTRPSESAPEPDGAADVAALREPALGAYRTIETEAALVDVARMLATRDAFAFDTETTGTTPVDAQLVGIALAWDVGSACYIPTQTIYGGEIPLETVRQHLGPVFAKREIEKVGHNLKYDLLVLEQHGISVGGALFDTMIAAFCADPTRLSFGLSRLALDLFQHEAIPITDLIGRGRDQLRMDQVPVEQVTEYAGEDADYSWRLYRYYRDRLATSGVESLFRETEMPLVRVLAEMERHGVALDADYLGTMSMEMQRRINALADQIHADAGLAFNIDSTKQLAEVLFDKLDFRVVRKTRTARSTDAETLEQLARETGHPLPGHVLEYRELQKLHGTYVIALPAARAKSTGRIHTSYHQTGAITGRLSSSEPNLQNIPIRTATGREIRRAFVPRTTDERLIVADYSQIELRILADFSGDEALRQAFADDVDIHAFVASQVNNVSLDEVTTEMRSRAKAVNFGIVYGQTAFGLARTTGMSRNEAQAFIDGYFRRYPRIRAFINECIATAKRDGYVRTILGRRRPIWDLDSRNRSARAQAERLAVNTVIQGSAADLIKTAMIRLDDRVRADELPLRLLLQVHDELVCEAPTDKVQALATVVREVMSTALPLHVPVKVDIGLGDNWLEAK